MSAMEKHKQLQFFLVFMVNWVATAPSAGLEQH